MLKLVAAGENWLVKRLLPKRSGCRVPGLPVILVTDGKLAIARSVTACDLKGPYVVAASPRSWFAIPPPLRVLVSSNNYEAYPFTTLMHQACHQKTSLIYYFERICVQSMCF